MDAQDGCSGDQPQFDAEETLVRAARATGSEVLICGRHHCWTALLVPAGSVTFYGVESNKPCPKCGGTMRKDLP